MENLGNPTPPSKGTQKMVQQIGRLSREMPFCHFFQHKCTAVGFLVRVRVMPNEVLPTMRCNLTVHTKQTTGTLHIHSQHVENWPQLGFYSSAQTTVPEVDQISNKSWLRFKGARASL